MYLSKERSNKQTSTASTSRSNQSLPRVMLFQEQVALFDKDDEDHHRRLLEWCQVQWTATVKKSIESSNSLFYHDCCGSFSRRGFSRVAGHPWLATCSVLRLPGFKEVDSPDKLYHWMVKNLCDRAQSGKATYFPALNRYHLRDEDMGSNKDDEEVEVLRKRADEMLASLQDNCRRIRALEISNDRLLNSTKHWYSKYEELMDKKRTANSPDFLTPQKHKPNADFDVPLEDSY